MMTKWGKRALNFGSQRDVISKAVASGKPLGLKAGSEIHSRTILWECEVIASATFFLFFSAPGACLWTTGPLKRRRTWPASQ